MKFKLIISVILLTSFPLLVTGAAVIKPWHLLPNITFNSRECMMCKFSVSLVNYALRTQKGAEQIYRFTNSFCQIAHIESPLVCSNVTKLFNREIVKVLSNALVTSDQVCGYLSNNTCGHFNDPMADWEVNLNASTSLNQEELERLRAVHQMGLDSQREDDLKPYKVVHISDTHIDLGYQEGSISNCDEPLCCRTNSSGPVDGLPKIDAGYWGSYGACDVPLRTLESALKQINSTMAAQSDIEYIIWTGDIQPHDVWAQDKEAAIETYNRVFEKIFQYLPDVKIFPTFGNHEMVPVDSFSPSNLLSIARDDSPEWLYKKMDSFWSRWLPEDTVKTITKDGFYATLARPGLKVISLNTNFCHNKNFWLYIDATDPGDQLQWLIHELQISELQHEQVHIIGHIPPGSNDCLKVWSRNYNRIVRRFAKTITGQFFGHTHNNEFEIFYDDDFKNNSGLSFTKHQIDQGLSSPKPISVGLIGPSITTFVDLNPSFRIYTLDPSISFTPIQFETYYLNITAANQMAKSSPEQNPIWEIKNFSDDFNVTDILPASMHNLLLEMIDELKSFSPKPIKYGINSMLSNHLDKTQSETGEGGHAEGKPPQLTVDTSKLYKLFRLFHNYSDLYRRDLYDKLTADEKKAFLCKFFSGQSHNTQACKQIIGDNVNFNYVSVV